jgi:hypothetical protein
MSQDYYDRYRGLLEGTDNGYAPLLEQLRERFGLNFLVENMGSGCEAIRAVMEGGWEIHVTDGDDFVRCTVGRRLEEESTRGPLGWTVGIYKLSGDDQEAEDLPTVAEQDFTAYTDGLVSVVEKAVRRLISGEHG